MIHARPAQSPEYYLTPDCPTQDGQIEARWGGKGSKLLGLGDEFGTLSYLRLAKGLNPETGTKLTARLKSNRKEADDITITVPKSVSVLIEVGQDQRVKDALWEANAYAMSLVEKEAEVRVRKGGNQTDRKSGNITYAAFYHGTTRPLKNGMPDPNSHIHNYVFNVSFDKQEGLWKAFKRHHVHFPTIEKKFHKRLASNLRDIGYEVNATRSAFEVRGVAPEVLDLFTRRQDEIKVMEKAKEAKGERMTEAYKAKMSQVTRLPKQKGLLAGEVREYWRSKLDDSQRNGLGAVSSKARLTATRSRWLGKLKHHVAKLRSFTKVRETETRETVRSRNSGRTR